MNNAAVLMIVWALLGLVPLGIIFWLMFRSKSESNKSKEETSE